MGWASDFLRFWPRLMAQDGPDSPGPYGPGQPLIIWKNILSQICSKIILEMHTAPRACSKICFWSSAHSNNAPGAYLTLFFQIVNGPGVASPGPYGPGGPAGPGP